MTKTLLSDVSITLNQRRCTCVLDPTLALSDYGLLLAKQLGKLMELWIVREFWHMLDNTYFYCQQAEWVRVGEEDSNHLISVQQYLSPQTIRTLKEWERLRQETDLGNHNLFWIGDGIGESLLPKETDATLVGRWEWLARSLDRQMNGDRDVTDPLTYAFRDAASLSAALGSAFILTHRSPEARMGNLAPVICSTLDHWGVTCQEIEANDVIATLEREQLRQLFIQAGVSKLFWTGLEPVVLHLVVPAAITANPPSPWSEEFSLTTLEDWQEMQGEDGNFWEGAKGFWYELYHKEQD